MVGIGIFGSVDSEGWYDPHVHFESLLYMIERPPYLFVRHASMFMIVLATTVIAAVAASSRSL